MSDHDFDARLLDLLYGELPPDEAKAVQAEIDQDPVARKTLEAWGAVREAVADLPTPEPDPQVHYTLLRAARAEVEPVEAKGFFAWLSRFAMSPAFAGAAAVMVLAVGSLVYFNQQDAEPDSALDRAANEAPAKGAAPGTPAHTPDPQLAAAGGEASPKTGEAEEQPPKVDEKKADDDAPALAEAEAKDKAAARAENGLQRGDVSKAGFGAADADADGRFGKDLDGKRANAPEGEGGLDLEEAKAGTKTRTAVAATADPPTSPAPRTAAAPEKKSLEFALRDAEPRQAAEGRAKRTSRNVAPRKAKTARVENRRASAAKTPPPPVAREVAENEKREDVVRERAFAPPPPAKPAVDDAREPAPFAEVAAAPQAPAADTSVTLDGAAAAASKADAPRGAPAEVDALERVEAAGEADSEAKVVEEAEAEDAAPARPAPARDADEFAVDAKVADGAKGVKDEEAAKEGAALKAEPPPADAPADDLADDAAGGDDVLQARVTQGAQPQPTVVRSTMTPDALRGAGGGTAGAVGGAPAVPDPLRAARAARERGDHQTAVTAYKQYFNQFPRHGELSRSLFETAASYEALGDAPQAIRFYALIQPSAGAWYARAQERLAALRAVRAAPPRRPAPAEAGLDTLDQGEDRAEPMPEPPAVDSPIKQ